MGDVVLKPDDPKWGSIIASLVNTKIVPERFSAIKTPYYEYTAVNAKEVRWNWKELYYCTENDSGSHLGSYLTLLYQNASPDMLKFSISFNYSTKGTGNFICYTCDIPISGESEALSVIDIIKSYGFGAGFLASTVAAKILSVARNTDLSRSTPNLFSRPNAKYNF